MAVLNISNVTSQGGVVLNDLTLLELLQMYPFLYNRRVHPYKDADYDNWAWEKITTSFNRSYNNTVLHTTESLQQRWEELQPIVYSLSKVYNINIIPPALRHIVVKISVQLEDVADGQHKLPYIAESIILENIDMVSRLPLNERQQLEAELMDLILNTELASRGAVKLTTINMSRIEQQYEGCLQDMGLKNNSENKTPDLARTTQQDGIQEEEIVQTIVGENSNSDSPLDDVPTTCNKNDLRNTPELLQRRSPSFQIPYGPSSKKEISDTPSKHKKPLSHYAALKRQWRPCVVRLKRHNFEDYVPLSKVKKETLTKSSDSLK